MNIGTVGNSDNEVISQELVTKIRQKIRSVFNKINNDEKGTENKSSTIYLLSEMEKRIEDLLIKLVELEKDIPKEDVQV